MKGETLDNRTRTGRLAFGDLIVGRVPEVYQERYKKERIRTNISRMFGLSVYMIAIQIILNIINILKPATTKEDNIGMYIALSLTALLTGVVFLILSILCKKNRIRNERAQKLLPLVLIYLYVGYQMIFFKLNIKADTGGMNSYVIGVILMCFCMVLRPIHNIINVVICMGYAFLLMFSMRNENGVWDAVMITDTWANLIIITALILFMSTLTYHMYMDNFINRVKLEESAGRAKRLARLDTLTGVMNRRGFFEMLDGQWQRMREREQVVAIAMFDIDHFKSYNDYYGHLEGDNCLFKVSELLQSHFVSRGGSLCRFGGEEFLAFFIPDNREHAMGLVKEVCKKVEGLQITGVPEFKDQPYVTISAGIVIHSAAETGYEELINCADIALYQSKYNGRNQVTEYSEYVDREFRNVRSQAENGMQQYRGTEKRNKRE